VEVIRFTTEAPSCSLVPNVRDHGLWSTDKDAPCSVEVIHVDLFENRGEVGSPGLEFGRQLLLWPSHVHVQMEPGLQRVSRCGDQLLQLLFEPGVLICALNGPHKVHVTDAMTCDVVKTCRSERVTQNSEDGGYTDASCDHDYHGMTSCLYIQVSVRSIDSDQRLEIVFGISSDRLRKTSKSPDVNLSDLVVGAGTETEGVPHEGVYLWKVDEDVLSGSVHAQPSGNSRLREFDLHNSTRILLSKHDGLDRDRTRDHSYQSVNTVHYNGTDGKRSEFFIMKPAKDEEQNEKEMCKVKHFPSLSSDKRQTGEEHDDCGRTGDEAP